MTDREEARRAAPVVDQDDTRNLLAQMHIRGSGIEIGALHQPLAVPAGTSVTYVDRLREEGLRAHYPELADLPLIGVDVVDDGESLATFGDATQDFVIANHFLEHTEDPIGTLENHLRVLRREGTLYLGIPDKRAMFDSARPLTTTEHLERDHLDGPEWSRADHYLEWVELVNDLEGEEARKAAHELMIRGYSIHFHVWIPDSFREFLLACQNRFRLPLNLAEFRQGRPGEFLVILKRA